MNLVLPNLIEPTISGSHAGLMVAQAAGGQASMISTLMMMGMIFVIFYFLLIRPQQKEQKAHKKMLDALQKGQQVVTASGLHGRVHDVGDGTVVLEVASNVRVTVDKFAVKRRQEG